MSVFVISAGSALEEPEKKRTSTGHDLGEIRLPIRLKELIGFVDDGVPKFMIRHVRCIVSRLRTLHDARRVYAAYP